MPNPRSQLADELGGAGKEGGAHATGHERIGPGCALRSTHVGPDARCRNRKGRGPKQQRRIGAIMALSHDGLQLVCCGQAVVRCYQHRAAAAYAITASAPQTWNWSWRKSSCVNPSSRGVVSGGWSGTRQLDTIRIGPAGSFAEVSDSSDVSCRRAVLVLRLRFSDRGQRRLHHQPADRSFGHF